MDFLGWRGVAEGLDLTIYQAYRGPGYVGLIPWNIIAIWIGVNLDCWDLKQILFPELSPIWSLLSVPLPHLQPNSWLSLWRQWIFRVNSIICISNCFGESWTGTNLPSVSTDAAHGTQTWTELTELFCVTLGLWTVSDLDIVAYACHPSIWEAEGGGYKVQGQPDLLSEWEDSVRSWSCFCSFELNSFYM